MVMHNSFKLGPLSVVTPEGLLPSGVVAVENGRIAGVWKDESEEACQQRELPILEIPTGSKYLLPGFIDIHIHGSSGYDVMDGTKEALDHIRKRLPETGVTSFLAATMTMSREKIHQALNNVRRQMLLENSVSPVAGDAGARVLGVHLEGPFLNPGAKGAQDAVFMTPPNMELIEDHLDVVKLVTLAPELDQTDYPFIREAKNRGLKISMGHTQASYDTAREAILAGVGSATHLFNAMTPLHHRNPGVVGAALIHDIYTELIADDVHVHPALYDMVIRAKGTERVVLITDAMMGQCMACGSYELGGQTVRVSKNDARLTDGTLAGSVLTMDRAFRHVMTGTGRGLTDMARLTATNAADLLERTDLGRIVFGARADFVLMDENHGLLGTIVDGRFVWKIGGCHAHHHSEGLR